MIVALQFVLELWHDQLEQRWPDRVQLVDDQTKLVGYELAGAGAMYARFFGGLARLAGDLVQGVVEQRHLVAVVRVVHVDAGVVEAMRNGQVLADETATC